MAKKQSMTFEEALQVILSSEGDNPLRAMLELAAQGALEVEMSEHVGAKPYERSEGRSGYRNGHRVRILTTAVGDLNLLVPQDRDGTFQTSLFERYQRSDKAFVLAYNLGNFLRRFALPREVSHWSLSSIQLKLIKIGAKIISHSRMIVFQMAEVAVPEKLFRSMLSRIHRLGRACARAPALSL